MRNVWALCLGVALLSRCFGMRETNNQCTTHAECFRVIGYAIPEDDQAAARALVTKGGTITDVRSSPADWHSVVGFIGNLFWVHQAKVSGTK